MFLLLEPVNVIELKLQCNFLVGSSSDTGSVLLAELLGVGHMYMHGLGSATHLRSSLWLFLFSDFPLSQPVVVPDSSVGLQGVKAAGFLLDFNCPAQDRLKELKRKTKKTHLLLASPQYGFPPVFPKCLRLIVLEYLHKVFWFLKKIFFYFGVIILQLHEEHSVY